MLASPESSDLVERLRAGHKYSGIVDPLDIEAADEIVRLRLVIKELREKAIEYV